MNTRHATIADAAAIADFVSKLAAEHIAPSLTKGGVDKLLTSLNADATQQRIAAGWPHICAIDGDDLVGVVVVKPPTHLYHLFVRTDLQRTGIGRQLFEIAEEWTKKATDDCLATVNSSLNAIPVYTRFAFEADGPVIDTDGVRYQPMVRQRSE